MPERVHVDTKSGYDRWAAIYDDELNPLVLLEEDVVRGWVKDAGGRMGIREDEAPRNPDVPRDRSGGSLAGLHVADVGCGTGRHAVWLAANGASVDAYDFSTGMLARARAKLDSRGVRVHDHALPDSLPAHDHAFDVVLLALVADHIAELETVLRDLRRATRPGGVGIVTVLHPAMNLLGVTARFTDPESGREVRVQAFEHTYADYVMAVLRAGWTLDEIVERKAEPALVARTPRAEKYLGWPLLLAMRLNT